MTWLVSLAGMVSTTAALGDCRRTMSFPATARTFSLNVMTMLAEVDTPEAPLDGDSDEIVGAVLSATGVGVVVVVVGGVVVVVVVEVLVVVVVDVDVVAGATYALVTQGFVLPPPEVTQALAHPMLDVQFDVPLANSEFATIWLEPPPVVWSTVT